MRIEALVVALGLGLAVTPVVAHHAFTPEFDEKQPVSLTGTITKIDWVNPHAWLYIDVKNPDGTVVNWALELGSPNQLFRRGWRKDSLPTGVTVVVTGYRARSGKPVANGRTVKLPDGEEFFAGSPGTGAPLDGAGAAGARR